MADALYELLQLDLDADLDAHDAAAYLARLTTLPLAALSSSEPQSLSQSSHSVLRALQALAKRSHKPVVAATDRLLLLAHTLQHLARHAATLDAALPALDTAAHAFAAKYSKSPDNATLDRRRKAMLLARNMDRLADVLDLPTLLSSAIASSAMSSAMSSTASTTASTTSTATASNANYASALDLHAHIKRLHSLYPHSQLVAALAAQAEHEMKTMTTNLIASLHAHGLKLPAAMRTIGWLRRVAPDLDDAWSNQTAMASGEGSLGALFLVCRLACLESTLGALDPLRDLADHDTVRRLAANTNPDGPWSAGQQTEKYLKKYLEVFREQSFAVISMYKSIFPSALPTPDGPAHGPSTPLQPIPSALPTPDAPAHAPSNPLQPIPSALATFPLHLVEMLFDTLRHYLPNVQDRSARDSLLTQVLYCAGSLGRLGADFSIMIALLEEDLRAEMELENVTAELDSINANAGQHETEEEWVQVMKKHRVQASRLELLASGVGTARTSSPLK